VEVSVLLVQPMIKSRQGFPLLGAHLTSACEAILSFVPVSANDSKTFSSPLPSASKAAAAFPEDSVSVDVDINENEDRYSIPWIHIRALAVTGDDSTLRLYDAGALDEDNIVLLQSIRVLSPNSVASQVEFCSFIREERDLLRPRNVCGVLATIEKFAVSKNSVASSVSSSICAYYLSTDARNVFSSRFTVCYFHGSESRSACPKPEEGFLVDAEIVSFSLCNISAQLVVATKSSIFLWRLHDFDSNFVQPCVKLQFPFSFQTIAFQNNYLCVHNLYQLRLWKLRISTFKNSRSDNAGVDLNDLLELSDETSHVNNLDNIAWDINSRNPDSASSWFQRSSFSGLPVVEKDTKQNVNMATVEIQFSGTGAPVLPQFISSVAQVPIISDEVGSPLLSYPETWTGSEFDPSSKVELSTGNRLLDWKLIFLRRSPLRTRIITSKFIEVATSASEKEDYFLIAFERVVETYLLGSNRRPVSEYQFEEDVIDCTLNETYTFVLTRSGINIFSTGKTDKIWTIIRTPVLLHLEPVSQTFSQLTSFGTHLLLIPKMSQTFDQLSLIVSRGESLLLRLNSPEVVYDSLMKCALEEKKRIVVSRDIVINGHLILVSALRCLTYDFLVIKVLSESVAKLQAKFILSKVEESFANLGDIFMKMSRISQAAQLYARSSLHPKEVMKRLQQEPGPLSTYLHHHLQNPPDRSIAILRQDSELVSMILTHFQEHQWYQFSQVFLRT
jgi:hypothetical protein